MVGLSFCKEWSWKEEIRAVRLPHELLRRFARTPPNKPLYCAFGLKSKNPRSKEIIIDSVRQMKSDHRRGKILT